MSIRLDVRTGGRAGRSVTTEKAYITLGRHLQADLRFDDADLPVSVRHAAIVRRDARYFLRDLGSTNGTYVNGKRILGDCILAHGDLIELGRGGPRAVVSLVPLQLTLPIDEAPVSRPAVRAEPRLRPTPALGITAAGIEATIRRRDAAVRRYSVGAALAVAMLLAGGVWEGLHRAAGKTELLSRAARTAAGSVAMDVAAVTRSNRAAVGVVTASFGDGGSFTGTGFVIRADDRSALVVTARHLVSDAGGTAAGTISLVLDGTKRILPAQLLALHPTADIALLRVPRSGLTAVRLPEPAAASLADGQSVALLGFPLGLDLPMGGDWRRAGVTATSGTGTITRLLPALLQIDGFGAQGSSGSPVFDARGRLQGVLYGAERESAGRILYAVPLAPVLELLRGATTSR